MPVPSRFFSGVSTGRPLNPCGNLPFPFPFDTQAYANDFNTYAATDWTVTGSTGTTALTPGSGGLILQTTAATINDVQANQLAVATYAISAGLPCWFVWRGQLGDVTVPSFATGLMQGASALTPTDGIYFTKAAGATAIVLNVAKASVVTSVTLTGFTPVNGVNFMLAFYYDGRAIPSLFAWAGATMNPNLVGPPLASGQNSFTNYFSSFQAITPLPGTSVIPNLPVVNLSPIVGIKAASAVAKTLTTDCILVANDVVR